MSGFVNKVLPNNYKLLMKKLYSVLILNLDKKVFYIYIIFLILDMSIYLAWYIKTFLIFIK